MVSRNSLSITRRSAALPYSVLSIVSGDQLLLDQAFDCLMDLALVENKRSSDVTKVHSFNILRVILLDARQTKMFDRYFERAVTSALNAFASPK